MSVAADLFYREGIRATGVDRIVEVSGVSKTSLYRVFQSKDELIAAHAEAHDQRFWDKWNKAAEVHQDSPLDQINAALDDGSGEHRAPGVSRLSDDQIWRWKFPTKLIRHASWLPPTRCG